MLAMEGEKRYNGLGFVLGRVAADASSVHERGVVMKRSQEADAVSGAHPAADRIVPSGLPLASHTAFWRRFF